MAPADKATALVVSAHAADFVWRCGGAIALHQQRGWNVSIVCLSFGERGESAKLWKESGADLTRVKAARRNEAEAAARHLAAHDIQFFDLGDYPLTLGREALFRLVDVMRAVQPRFILTHAREDPYNTDHAATMRFVLDARMTAQAWGHNPGETVLGAPQVYLFEPHQAEQCHWKPDTLLDISAVWEQKRAAIEAMRGQEHLWQYYTNLAVNRANHFRRNSGGQAGGRAATHAEAFESVFPRVVDAL
jgi:4-oxalomesaconate hydratase